jgi:hypothetical protein
MKNIYKKNISILLMVLVIMIPLNISLVLAQGYTIPDAPQACIEKNKQGEEIIELMDNEIISTLEKSLQALHAFSTIWESQIVVIDMIVLIQYKWPGLIMSAKTLETWRNTVNAPFGVGGAGKMVHYLVTCRIMTGQNKETGNVEDEGIFACNWDIPLTNGMKLPLSPFDNIYAAAGCLCLPGVLFNLRKLQTIYKTNNCCVEQACTNGVSVDVCSEQLEEAMCMWGGMGSAVKGILNGLMSIARGLIFNWVWEEFAKELPDYVGTLISLANAPFKIQALIQALDKIQETFSDPTCEDLGFGKLKAKAREERQQCEYIPIDLNGDGIYDRMDYVCKPVF